MNKLLVQQKIEEYLANLDKENSELELEEREEKKKFYQGYSKEKILNMTEEELDNYIKKLWMYNPFHISLKRIKENGFDKVKQGFAYLLYGDDDLASRWNTVYKDLKGVGPSMMSELLAHIYPYECIVFNATTRKAYSRFGIKYSNKNDGKSYLEVCEYGKEIGSMISEKSDKPCDLLLVDYFLYEVSKKKDIDNDINTNSDVDDIRNSIYQEDGFIDDIIEVFDEKKNIILAGVPGVGKTHIAFDIIKLLELKQKHSISSDLINRVVFTQFHQSYGYEEFVEGVVLNDGKLVSVDGIFKKLVDDALKNKNLNYYIIIDEINRGNVSKIFGELLMCIEADKRKPKYSVKLMYSKMRNEEKIDFYVPENVYIIGTMNTADRSLEPIDYALRRRFSFFHLKTAFGNFKFLKTLEESVVKNQIIGTMNHINKKLREQFGSDNFNIGHSYFIECFDEEEYIRILKYDIIPLLREYMLNDDEEICKVFKSTDSNVSIFNELLEGLEKNESKE